MRPKRKSKILSSVSLSNYLRNKEFYVKIKPLTFNSLKVFSLLILFDKFKILPTQNGVEGCN